MSRPLPWYPTISSVKGARVDLADPTEVVTAHLPGLGGGLAQEHIRNISTFLNFDDPFFWAV